MHGSHLLNDEYEISANRLGVPKESCENFPFSRSKLKSESSPICKRSRWLRIVNGINALLFTFILLLIGISRFVGPSNLTRIYAGTQLAAAYILPKLMVMKRDLPSCNDDLRPSIPSPRIMEILPIPLNLVVAFGNLKKAENILSKDPSAQLVIPSKTSVHSNSTLNYRIFFDYNSTSIFESLAFSWCESFHRNFRYPTRLIVTGPSEISSCVLGRYRWALKIPKETISFRATNSSEIENDSKIIYKCPTNNKDPYDCASKGREEVRFQYSQMCPDLAPFLLACQNKMTLERALAYKPPWKTNKLRN